MNYLHNLKWYFPDGFKPAIGVGQASCFTGDSLCGMKLI
jgi:hypothetical protein